MQGTIPYSWSRASGLAHLYFSGNKLTGEQMSIQWPLCLAVERLFRLTCLTEARALKCKPEASNMQVLFQAGQ